MKDHPSQDGSQQDLFGDVIDYQQFPLCNVTAQNEELSSLVCCASTHCLARNSVFSVSSSTSASVPESFLLMDSTYDLNTVAVSMNALFPDATTTHSHAVEQNSAIGEWTGSRIRATQETLFGNPSSLVGAPPMCPANNTNEQQEQRRQQEETDGITMDELPSVVWMMPSCLTRGFLVPSMEVNHLACETYELPLFHQSNYSDPITTDSNSQDDDMFQSFRSSCRPGRYGLTTTARKELDVTFWFDVDSWNYATVHGTSLRTALGLFVSTGVSALLPANETVGMMVADCAGPNCVVLGTDDEITTNACQALVQVQTTYHEVNRTLRIQWFLYLVLVVLLGLVIRSRQAGPVLSNLVAFLHNGVSYQRNQFTQWRSQCKNRRSSTGNPRDHDNPEEDDTKDDHGEGDNHPNRRTMADRTTPDSF